MVKAGLVVGGLVFLLLFLIVVDLGVNAGRIHYGVSVAGRDLGGKTRSQATEILEARSKEISLQPILLTAEGLNVGIDADGLGWEPNVPATRRIAYDVGRRNAPFGAVADRVGCWLWGKRVDFVGKWDRETLKEKFDEWDKRLTALGKPLDREKLRTILAEAIARGETGPYEFPVEDP